MKSTQWDEKLFAADRAYIEVEEVRQAFEYLGAAAFHTELYNVQNSGQIKQKKYFPLQRDRDFAAALRLHRQSKAFTVLYPPTRIEAIP